MSEMQTRLNNSANGQIKIADEVIAIIAGTAAMEVEGVVSPQGEMAEPVGKRNLAKGVKVSVIGDTVAITIAIAIRYGHKLAEVSSEVQRRVKTAVETMTALLVTSVDITIAGVQNATN